MKNVLINKEPALEFVEQKGDVSFYKDKSGKLYQQYSGNVLPFMVRDGKMMYRTVNVHSGIYIKYNTNGVNGFSIWQHGKMLEDNFWEYQKANTCRIIYSAQKYNP